MLNTIVSLLLLGCTLADASARQTLGDTVATGQAVARQLETSPRSSIPAVSSLDTDQRLLADRPSKDTEPLADLASPSPRQAVRPECSNLAAHLVSFSVPPALLLNTRWQV